MLKPEINVQRLNEIVELGRLILRKTHPGRTHALRNALDEVDRLRPSGAMQSFGRGAVADNAAIGLKNAALKLFNAICDVEE